MGLKAKGKASNINSITCFNPNYTGYGSKSPTVRKGLPLDELFQS